MSGLGADTHELHLELIVPPGDLLIHAGDITVMSKRPWIYRHFNIWLGELPHRHKIVIPGNHGCLPEDPKGRKAITNAALPVGSGVEVEGLRICSYTAATLRLVTEVFANSGLAEYIQTGIRLGGSRS